MSAAAGTPFMLSPDLDYQGECPVCHVPLVATGWAITGMRSLARCRCPKCQSTLFGDLPTGQALYSPMILDASTGLVHDGVGVPWFANWLEKAYRERTSSPTPLSIEILRSVARPVMLLNCIDTLYGHALLKLLNAQQYLDGDTFDVVVIVQPSLRWLVPDGVAECWTADIPLRHGISWSEALAATISDEALRFRELYLAPAYSHPHPSVFDVARFTRVAPFALTSWRETPTPDPVYRVSFVWREDRQWLAYDGLSKEAPGVPTAHSQRETVVALFDALRTLCESSGATLDAAVVGIGAPGDMGAAITDMRAQTVTLEIERAWCRRYAESHLVIGVHGSNMLLPTAHAGSAIEIVPADRNGNYLQDLIFNGVDARDLFFRYRFVPLESSPVDVARLAAFILTRYRDFDRLMGRSHTRDASSSGHVRN